MRAVVVYESMFGNTHAVAQYIAEGLGTVAGTTVVSVRDATPELIATAHLVVVGGPTHVHGMSSERTRRGAEEMAADDDDLELDSDADGPGLRDWFDGLPDGAGRRAAAFDTRVNGTTLLTGQAAKGIAKRLRKHGFDVIIEPESFFVTKTNHLEDGESDRATAWGRTLAETVTGLEQRR